MRKLLSSFALLVASSAFGSTTFQLEIQEAYTSSGSHVAVGTIGILVADSDGSGTFSGSTAETYTSIVGTTLSAGSAIGTDRIVGVVQAADLGGGPGPFGFGDILQVFNTGGVTTNTKLAFYWFPGLTTIGDALAANQAQMGFYRNDLAADGGVAFAMPGSDSGATLNLLATSVSSGGTTPNLSLTAFNIAPEPSRAMLAGLGLMGLVIRRRRK